MKRAAIYLVLVALLGCREKVRPPPSKELPGELALVERVFQRHDESGEHVFTVRLTASPTLPPGAVELLERTLTIQRFSPDDPDDQGLVFWRDQAMAVDPDRPEIQVELIPAEAEAAHLFGYAWPDMFQISRPGVLEVRSGYEGTEPRAHLKRDDVGVIRQALHGAPHTAQGRLLCDGVAAPHVAVVIAGRKAHSQAPDGTFVVTGPFGGVPGTLFIAFEAPIPLDPNVTPRLQIMDDAHATRNERVDREPTVTGDVADFGDVTIPGTDCRLWRAGVTALEHYFRAVQAAPPAGELRIKRWDHVFRSRGAAPHAFYDYVVMPTDVTARATVFHELGHSIRHVADGDATHWHWDNFRFIYARVHGPGLVTNKGFAFNEGWAHYWRQAVEGGAFVARAGTPAPAFLDWNEERVGERLHAMALAAPGLTEVLRHGFVVNVLLSNPRTIHTMWEFEERYCTALAPAANPFCAEGRPVREAPPACPPGYSDDGATCRLNNIVSKPSLARGVGVPPNSCGPGQEHDAGLCYPGCPAGFQGVGPVCWQRCPAGYADDGATCRRDPRIIGSDNSACPWYDRCGVTLARGCSVCPAGFDNKGCTCQIDAHIFGKRTHNRGAGSIPSGCRAGMQYDAGLCYPGCPAGFTGVGPICWGSCPAGYADHGATCYRGPNVFSKD
jgi:hypothetical protein